MDGGHHARGPVAKSAEIENAPAVGFFSIISMCITCAQTRVRYCNCSRTRYNDVVCVYAVCVAYNRIYCYYYYYKCNASRASSPGAVTMQHYDFDPGEIQIIRNNYDVCQNGFCPAGLETPVTHYRRV